MKLVISYEMYLPRLKLFLMKESEIAQLLKYLNLSYNLGHFVY